MRHNQTVQEAATERVREQNKGKAREVAPDSEEEGSEERYSSPSEEWIVLLGPLFLVGTIPTSPWYYLYDSVYLPIIHQGEGGNKGRLGVKDRRLGVGVQCVQFNAYMLRYCPKNANDIFKCNPLS
ncbi:hypothetical protein PIB30_064193 [Stylosanthes scabra]|uniref:Uncharacterized protein n=1 Tax=Stylosanthes scabra TaxID=79078 RepID=A0ABU6TLH4_9FABA|nr:hypothetical protein [Stylosanthes scabra]